jgi:hypothetical protein
MADNSAAGAPETRAPVGDSEPSGSGPWVPILLLIAAAVIYGVVSWLSGEHARTARAIDRAAALEQQVADLNAVEASLKKALHKAVRQRSMPTAEETEVSLERASLAAANARLTDELDALKAEESRRDNLRAATLAPKLAFDQVRGQTRGDRAAPVEDLSELKRLANEEKAARKKLEADLAAATNELAQTRKQLAEARAAPAGKFAHLPPRNAKDFPPFKAFDTTMNDFDKLLRMAGVSKEFRSRYESRARSWRSQKSGIIKQFDNTGKNARHQRDGMKRMQQQATRNRDKQDQSVIKRLRSIEKQVFDAARTGLEEAYQAAVKVEKSGDWKAAAKLYTLLAEFKLAKDGKIAAQSAKALKRITGREPPADQKAAGKPSKDLEF